MRKAEFNKIIAIFLILCSVACVFGIMNGIDDLNRSKITYDELKYREYIFVSYEIDDNHKGGDKFYISVEGKAETLFVSELLTPHKYDDFEALQAGDKLYCYVYEDDGIIRVSEIKADKMIISLDEYNEIYRKNGVELIIIMSCLFMVSIAGAVVLSKKAK